MEAGLVSSLSGALAQQHRVDKIANNLANADTPGFKGDDLTFEEALQSKNAPDSRSDVPERPATESELASAVGKEQRVVLYGDEWTDLRSGAYKQTDNPLDVAIEGNGFLEVLTPNGIRLTRAGNLTVDSQGKLTNRDGFLVLGPGQAGKNLNDYSPTEAAQRGITLGNGKLEIDLEGNITSLNGGNRQVVGRLSLVQVQNPKALKKEGGNLFLASREAFAEPAPTVLRAPAGQEAAFKADPAAFQPAIKPNPLGPTTVAPKLHQGMVEGSNVNPVQEMTKLIEAQRMFDQNTKLMQDSGDMTSRLAEIGKF